MSAMPVPEALRGVDPSYLVDDSPPHPDPLVEVELLLWRLRDRITPVQFDVLRRRADALAGGAS